MADVTLAHLQQADAFSELSILFDNEPAVYALLCDLGADRTRDIPRLPNIGNLPFALYWRLICEKVENGMFARFGLTELVTEALRRNPGNKVLLGVVTRAGAASHGTPLPPDAQDLPDQLRVLCLLAGPDSLNELRLRQEYKIILNIARQRGDRALSVTTNPATQTDDIIGEILAARPHILHFSGHGTRDGMLVFEGRTGRPAEVRVEALGAVIGVLAEPLSCLVLGSCFSAAYSGALLGPARSVAGSLAALDDRAALEFTHGFYTGLAIGGTDTSRAYQAGLAQMRLHGYSTDSMRFDSRAGIWAR